MRDPAPARGLARILAALLLAGLAGCGGWPASIGLPGGPTRGTMTYDEAMGARSGLTRLERLPREDPPPARR